MHFFPVLYNILTSHISCCSKCWGTALEKNGVGEKRSALILCQYSDESDAGLPNILGMTLRVCFHLQS